MRGRHRSLNDCVSRSAELVCSPVLQTTSPGPLPASVNWASAGAQWAWEWMQKPFQGKIFLPHPSYQLPWQLDLFLSHLPYPGGEQEEGTLL